MRTHKHTISMHKHKYKRMYKFTMNTDTSLHTYNKFDF